MFFKAQGTLRRSGPLEPRCKAHIRHKFVLFCFVCLFISFSFLRCTMYRKT